MKPAVRVKEIPFPSPRKLAKHHGCKADGNSTEIRECLQEVPLTFKMINKTYVIPNVQFSPLIRWTSGI